MNRRDEPFGPGLAKGIYALEGTRLDMGQYDNLPYVVGTKEKIYTGRSGRQTNGMAIFVLGPHKKDGEDTMFLSLLVLNVGEHIEADRRARVFILTEQTLNVNYVEVKKEDRKGFLQKFVDAGLLVTNKKDIESANERRTTMAKKGTTKQSTAKGKGKDATAATRGRKSDMAGKKIKVLNKEPKFNAGSIRSLAFKQVRDGMTFETFIKKADKVKGKDGDAITPAQMKAHLAKLISIGAVELV
jgi:hypothetical protein